MVSNNGNLTMFSEALGTTASVEGTEFPYSSQLLKTWKRKNSHESNHPEGYSTNEVTENIRKIQRKTRVSESLFNKVADMQTIIL